MPHHQKLRKMLQLTKHFTLSEFIRSEKAQAKGIDNTPSLEAVSNLQYLCQQVLEHNSKGTYWLHVSCKRKSNRQMFRPNVKA